MKKTITLIYAALAVLWLAPVLMNDIKFDATVVKPMIAAGIFCVAFIACEHISNIYVVIGLTAAAAAGMTAVYHEALFTVAPVLCLNLYRLCVAADPVIKAPRLIKEIVIDLVFSGMILQLVKLFKWGFSPVSAKVSDLIFPVAFLMIFVLYAVFDRRTEGGAGFAGIIPMRFNKRSLCVLSALLLILSSLVLFDGKIFQSTVVFYQFGVHMLFFPWAMYVFALLRESADAVDLLPEKLARL